MIAKTNYFYEAVWTPFQDQYLKKNFPGKNSFFTLFLVYPPLSLEASQYPAVEEVITYKNMNTTGELP